MTLNTNGPAPLMEAGGIASAAYGQYTGDGSGAITIPLGFSPMGVKVWNMTDHLYWEWNAGMAATHSLMTTGSTGVITDDTSSAIVSNHVITSNTGAGVYDPGQNGAGEGSLINTTFSVDAPDQTKPKLVLASASLNINGKLYCWEAMG